jgi:hypothetical protein
MLNKLRETPSLLNVYVVSIYFRVEPNSDATQSHSVEDAEYKPVFNNVTSMFLDVDIFKLYSFSKITTLLLA